MINILLPDGSKRQYAEGVTALEIAKSISEGLARNVLAAKINNNICDATMPINNDSTVTLYTWNDEEGKAVMWHSSAHIMAEAIQFYYPDAKFAIGPNIERGFYYDIDFGEKTFSSDDFKKSKIRCLR